MQSGSSVTWRFYAILTPHLSPLPHFIHPSLLLLQSFPPHTLFSRLSFSFSIPSSFTLSSISSSPLLSLFSLHFFLSVAIHSPLSLPFPLLLHHSPYSPLPLPFSSALFLFFTILLILLPSTAPPLLLVLLPPLNRTWHPHNTYTHFFPLFFWSGRE